MNPALAARVRQLRAEAGHRRAVAEFRARRRHDEETRQRALLTEVIAVLAAAVAQEDRCARCAGCTRALSRRRRNCPRCGHPVTSSTA